MGIKNGISFLQHAAGEDVLLYWHHYGSFPGRIRAQDPTRSADPDNSHGESLSATTFPVSHIHSPSQEHEKNTHSLRIQHIIFIFKDCRLTMLTNINKGFS